MPSAHVRPYDDADAPSWLRCRLLSFFATQYYDDVVTGRPRLDEPSIQLVGVVGDDVVGILDVSVSAHAPIEREAQLRARFRRVHMCRQYVLSLDGNES